MNKSHLPLWLFLTFTAGFLLSRQTTAQPAPGQKPKTLIVDDAVMKRLTQLAANLNAKGDKQTLAQVTSLLNASITLQKTTDATMAVGLLNRLRTGHTNEVIEVLEIQLDSSLSTLGNSPIEIGDAQIKALKIAKEYRSQFPHKSPNPELDASIAHAFELLEKK